MRKANLQKVAMGLYRLCGSPVRAAYGKRVWWKYLLPRRLTLKSNPAIYRWLFWNFGWI